MTSPETLTKLSGKTGMADNTGCAPPHDIEERYAADFVLALLAELRANNYRPIGWLRFLGRSWRQSRMTAQHHPALTASWRRTSAGLALALAGVGALDAASMHTTTSHAAVPPALPLAGLWLALASGDAYVHLGLNNTTRGEPVFESIGAPTTLTLARRGIAGLLWGRLLSGRPARRGYLALALAAALVTDIADGAVARTQARTTRLGGYLDGLADFEFWTALALTLGAHRLLPRWLLLVLLARWLGPLTVAYAAYFGNVSRVPLSSTALGKISGGAQAATLAVALLPEVMQQRIAPLRAPLHAATALLLLAAPLAHLWKLRDGTHTIQSRRRANA